MAFSHRVQQILSTDAGASVFLTQGWDVTSTASFSLAIGNKDSMAYNLQLLANKKFGQNELGADYLYAEQNNAETTDSLRLFGQRKPAHRQRG